MDIPFIPANPNNFMLGRQGHTIDAILCHWIVGHQAAADATFQIPNRKASAHYSIENQSVHLHVREKDTAFSAGNWDWNLRSVSIEHAGGPDIPITDATYETSATLIADIATRYGIPLDRDHVKRHQEVSDNPTSCPGTLNVDRLVARAKQLQTQGGNPNDMTPEEIARGIRRVTNPTNTVSDDVIHADAARILAEGKIDGVLTDNLTSLPWRNPEQADVYAIESYATADGIDSPHQFAVGKVQAQASPTQVFREVLGTLKGWLNDKDTQIATLNANIAGQATTIANDADTIKGLQDQLAQAPVAPETPPVVEAPTPSPQPVEPAQPLTTSETPQNEEASFWHRLYLLITGQRKDS